MDSKIRKLFNLYDKHGAKIGHGTYYHQGNVQCYMQTHKQAAWQFSSLADVLHLDGVAIFRWAHAESKPSISQRRKARYQFREARVLYAGYQISYSWLCGKDVKGSRERYTLHDPTGTPIKDYQHKTRAVTGAVKHVEELILRSEVEALDSIYAKTVERYQNYKE